MRNPRPRPRRYRAALPLYLLATATSLFGNGAINVVLPWLVMERTHDPAATGLVAAAATFPAALAALAGGMLIDRFGRRRICVLADVGSALSVAALAIVDATSGLTVPWFIALGAAGAVFDLPGMTARETMLADLSRASGRSLDAIAGWRQGIYGAAFLAGPAMAGLMLTHLSAGAVLWVVAACSAVAAAAIAAMPLPAVPAGAQATGVDEDVRHPLAGFGVVRRSRPLVLVLALGVTSAMLFAPVTGILLPAHFEQLGQADRLGFTLSAFAVGTVLGSAVYGSLLARRRLTAWITANVAFTACFCLVATLDGFGLPALGMAMAGLGQGLQAPIVSVAMTEHVPERLRGRVFGLMTCATQLAGPIGLALVSVVLAGRGLAVGAWLLAVVWVPVAVAASVSPTLRAWITGRSGTLPDPRDEVVAAADPADPDADAVAAAVVSPAGPGSDR